MKLTRIYSKIIGLLLTILCLLVVDACTKAKLEGNIHQDPITLENDTLKIMVDPATGCFTVEEKISGQVWNPDPWQQAAGLLYLSNSKGKTQVVNLSKSKDIKVSKKDDNSIGVRFAAPVLEDGTIAQGVVVVCEIFLDQNSSKIDVQVSDFESGSYRLIKLRYPSRQFSLKTDVDRGAAVIPQKQGIICPSYIFPMNGGRFCKWDDATYNKKSVGTLPLYGNGIGLSMPWWGTYNEKSAVVGILDPDSEASLEFNINNNGQYLFNSKGEMSPYERIVFLDPVWKLEKHDTKRKISYQFIPKGNYVDMAKAYRKEAIERGNFVSLKDKAKLNPNVNKLAGAVYFGIYGGYPHYVNMPGMAFTFDQLKDIIQVSHDELYVQNAFFHAWGVFSNFVPNCWPINEDLGGVSKLKEVVDLTKKYGYMYSSYHAYTAMLENDPDFSTKLMSVDKEGKLVRTGSRWGRIDSEHYKELASENLEKEIKALDLEADITDIAFVDRLDPGRLALAEYLRSLNLVMGTEHGQEFWIPYFDAFEGMTYLEGATPSVVAHKAPLFNLVYHDAIALFGKIQDPDNEVTANGDFRIKSLRNILFGIGTQIFFSPYEFDGMHDMIKMANELVSPVHKKTLFSELLSHEFLSDDFKVQKSYFSCGVEVIVNLGPVTQVVEGNVRIPGYGFQITDGEGHVKKGQFKLDLTIN